ncbi:putative TOMM peptide [Streptomyces sp. NPDC052196]|uniref:putative TOMM peptide n=1 Tax=Streptomyces sp. NPDC052196 TaxID=3156691 RepID=UPI00343D0CDF
MSTLTIVTPSGSARSPRPDHRLALLTARAGLEPELAQRYFIDPASVLVEFGLNAAESVYFSQLGASAGDLVIEDLDRPDAAGGDICYYCPLEAGRPSEMALI